MSNNFPIINLLQNARDGVTKALMVVDYSHHEIHSGSKYYVEGTVTLSDTEQIAIRFTTPSGPEECHFTWDIVGSGETAIKLWEDCVGGMTGGTTKTVLNQNRNSTKASSVVFAADVSTSTTSKGAQLHDWNSGQAAATPARSALPSEAGRDDELALKIGSTHIALIESNSTGNNVSYHLSWYEHAPSTGLKVAD